MYIEKLLTHVWRIGVPELVEGTFILMEMCHTVPELAEGSGTRMTLFNRYLQIISMLIKSLIMKTMQESYIVGVRMLHEGAQSKDPIVLDSFNV